MRKLLSVFSLIIVLTTLSVQHVRACWGTRPLAMGGAFTGLADDANCVYWNPAGYGLLDKKINFASHMLTDADRNRSNYDEYLAAVWHFSEDKGAGFAFTGNTDIFEATAIVKDSNGVTLEQFDYKLVETDTYLQGGMGERLTEDLAVGFSVKVVNYQFEEKFQSRYYSPGRDSASHH